MIVFGGSGAVEKFQGIFIRRRSCGCATQLPDLHLRLGGVEVNSFWIGSISVVLGTAFVLACILGAYLYFRGSPALCVVQAESPDARAPNGIVATVEMSVSRGLCIIHILLRFSSCSKKAQTQRMLVLDC